MNYIKPKLFSVMKDYTKEQFVKDVVAGIIVAIIALPLAFFCCWLFSVTDKSAQAEKERAAYNAQFVRSMTGVGASGASDH